MIRLLSYLFEQDQQLEELVSEPEMQPIIETWGEVFRVNPSKTD